MTTVIILFAIAFLAGAAAQQGRLGASSTSRKLGMVGALVFMLIYFGYVVGKNLAHRDNQAEVSSSTSLDGTSPQPS